MYGIMYSHPCSYCYSKQLQVGYSATQRKKSCIIKLQFCGSLLFLYYLVYIFYLFILTARYISNIKVECLHRQVQHEQKGEWENSGAIRQ